MECIKEIINIVSGLWDPIAWPIIELEENFGSLKQAMEELKCTRNDVKTRVDVAERELLKCKDEVQYWLKKVEEAEGEVNEKEEAFKKMMRCLWNCHPNCWSGYKLGKWVEKKLKDVAVLKSKGDSFKEVANKQLPDAVEEKPHTSAVARDFVLEKVLCWLSACKVGVIGIYGMGGVGKTTLLNDINNKFLKRTDDFDVVIWVVVSKELNVEKIQNDIGNRLGLSWSNNENNNETRAHKIYNVLSSTKFMLLLDDIWEKLDLDMVGIPHPRSQQNMSKVVFTTRSEDVCYGMAVEKKMRVECLPEQEAMDLFRRNVGEEAMNCHPDIPILAKSVAKECKGLPLALITIGRAMACKKTPQEWKHALSVLSTSKPPSEISGMDDEMLLRLKFSYDNLFGNTIKSCFLYCSLFPEDYSITKEKLIDYWIGEGFLDGWDDDLDQARNKGHDIIGRLKTACLLESGSDEKTEVKLHDVIRDMALWIGSDCGKKKNRILVRAGFGLSEAPEVERWKEAKRISLMNNDIKEITETPRCPNLLTLMLQRNPYKKIHTEFFQFMPLLRVLDLSGSSILHLPAGVGNLAELRYLNLSRTDIRSLPEEIGNLVKLKQLQLEKTDYLCRFPPGAISKLSELRVMNLFYSYSSWKTLGGGLNMSDLEGLERLIHLNLSVSTVDSLERLLCSIKLRNVTRYLYLKRCKGLTNSNQLSSLFTAMKSLQGLTIDDCQQLVAVAIGGTDGKKDDDYHVSSLECLQLLELPNLNCIRVGRGCFRNLHTINITDCFNLKKIYGLLQLESLETIEIDNCCKLEEVIGTAISDDEVGAKGLMRLKYISLDNLPELTSICRYELHFPSLEEINVFCCPKLKKLPLSLHNAHNSVRKISGEKEWWDRLEWEEVSIQSYFLRCFDERQW